MEGQAQTMRIFLMVGLLTLHCLAQEANSYRPSAKETDKPAIFGYMILARGHEQYGVSVKAVYRLTLRPGAVCLLLLPVYLYLARRRRRPTA